MIHTLQRIIIILFCSTSFVYLITINNPSSNHFIDPVNYRKAAHLEKSLYQGAHGNRPLYRNIILLVLDGVPADLFYDPATTPIIHGYLNGGGVKCETVYAALPTVSAPNYYTILSGAPPFLHGVTGNKRRHAARDRVRNIFSYLEEFGLRTICIGFEWYRDLIGDSTSVYIPAECCEHDDSAGIVDALLRLIMTGTLPYFSFAHFLAPDNAAHATGSNRSHEYIESLKIIDTELGRLLPHVFRFYPDTLVIIMADHGMNRDGTHGGSDESSLRVPLVFLPPLHRPYKPAVRTIKRELFNVDIAPTIAALSGIPVPLFSTGSFVYEIYPGPSALEVIHDSIDKKEHLMELLHGRSDKGFTILQNTFGGAQLHDRTLGNKIIMFPEETREHVLQIQRVITAFLSLLFIIWVIYRSTAGMPALLILNAVVIFGIGITSRFIESHYIYVSACAVFLLATALLYFLFLRFIIDPAMEMDMYARFPYTKIMSPLLTETLLMSAIFVPFHTPVPDPLIFSFRFYSLAFLVPFIFSGILYLYSLLQRRGYLTTGNS